MLILQLQETSLCSDHMKPEPHKSILWNRVPLKGSFKGVYKGSIVRFYNAGASIVLIGFWGPLYYTYSKEPPPPNK